MRAIWLCALLLSAAPQLTLADDLRPPSAFAGIADVKARSVALFGEMAKVITSPRCMNCHPVDNHPRQGDDMHLHNPPVERWDDADFGPPGLHCNSCHGPKETAFLGNKGSIPGHEPWRLAPISMGWIGLTKGEICNRIKDPRHNGGRSLADIQKHHATDHLVGSAFEVATPGRTPAPGSQELLSELTQAWIDTGAACPED